MISSNYFWTVTLTLAFGTLLIRGSFIFLSSKIRFSERFKEILSFIPVAVLPAMIAPMVFFHQGQVAIVMGKERLIILILATLVSFYTRQMLITIGFGLIALYFATQYF